MKWQDRTLTEVLATRKAFRDQPPPHRPTRSRTEEEVHSEGFLRRGELGSEEKTQAVRYLQRKCRLSFAEAFGGENFEWRVALHPSPLLLEQQYDPASRSYYLFTGRITILPRKTHTHLTELSQTPPPAPTTLEAQAGLGWVFGQQSFTRAEITLHSGIVLQISHPGSSVRLIQRNCLMTVREKQQVVSRFKLFSAIQNLSKTHVPHFTARKFVKGESIYAIGEQPTHLYLVVEGEVAFESTLPTHVGEGSALRRTFLRRETMATTETVGRNNYFGEEEVLAGTTRTQNAKCSSIDCLLLTIPVGRLERLVAVPEFRRTLELSAALKQQARAHQISTLLSLTQKKEEPYSPSPQDADRFGQLKSAIYTHLCAQQRPFRSKLGKERRKVVHNHSLTVPEILPSAVKVSDFSMLNVNKAMYDKTLMRFRYHLKEIERSAQGKPTEEVGRGRSLQDIWRTLKLERSFNPQQERLQIPDEDGMASYLAHQRMARHIRETKCMRPKSLHCNNKLKSEYIEYLQMAL